MSVSDTKSAITKFVDLQQKLIDLERVAEIEQTEELRNTLSTSELQQRGLCLTKLMISGLYTGFGGKCHVDLEVAAGAKEPILPAHKFRPGDIVTISQNIKASASVNFSATSGSAKATASGKKSTSTSAPSTSSSASTNASSSSETNDEADTAQGVVYRSSDTRITVALRDPLPSHLQDCVLRLDMGANDVTYKRCCSVLKSLSEDTYSSLPSARLVDVLFGKTEPEFAAEKIDPKKINWVNAGLNEVQKDTIAFALSAKDLALIHGPPGTGKTTTVVELIHQIIKKEGAGVRILTCGPSNVSVDNIVERLAPSKVSVLRIGHPARMLPSVLAHSLDSVLATSDGGKLVADIKKEMDTATKKLASKITKQERRDLRFELKELKKELKRKEKESVHRLLQNTQVICCTLTGAMSKMLVTSPVKFDWVIIDEAPQSMELHCWMAILKGKRLILSGDHKQLPPTILSDEAEKKGLSVTLFDRMVKKYGDKCTKLLTVQYRMNAKIMQWSSDEMYSGKLTSAPSVKEHLLCELPKVKKTEETSSALFFIDTTGCSLYETESKDDESKSNEGEAEVVVKHVNNLLEAGVQEHEIAVITPYNAQVGILRSKLSVAHPKIEIGSVDGFQGREKEAVVISLVRSNDDRQVGFLSEHRRLNVAVTRARRHVCLIGDSDTVSSDKFLSRLVDWFTEHGELRSAEEYLQ